MGIQSGTARDKQILAFGRRERVVKAAIEFVRACQTGQLVWRGEAERALHEAVMAYRPTLFGGSAQGKSVPQHGADHG